MVEKLKEAETHKQLFKGMIVQGLLRLMEKQVRLRCRPEDNEVVESLLEECCQAYSEFVKEETGMEKTCEIELVKTVPLKDSDTK